MFSTSRRPVPSTAALRILRQLAYISSGTACGAAALIAEERRRQTRVAKKIVDNTRRLKQHPRYAHSATAHSTGFSPIAADGNPIEDEERDEAVFSAAGAYGLDSAVRRGPHLRPESDAFRDGVLPSEVEKGYRKFTRRQSNSRSPHHNHNGTDTQPRQSHPGRRAATEKSETGAAATFASSAESSRVKRLGLSDLEARSHQKAHREPPSPPRHDQGLRSLPRIDAHPPSSARPNASLFHLLEKPALPSVHEVEQLVSAFAALYPAKHNAFGVESVVLASRLLDVTTRVGSLKALREISSWLLLTSCMDVHHLETICISLPTVLSHNDTKLTCDFFLDFLMDKSVATLKDINVYRLLATAGLLKTDPGFHAVRSLITVVKCDQHHNRTETLFGCLRKLLDLQRHSNAFQLLETCHHYNFTYKAVTTTQTAVVEELVEHLIRIDNLRGSALMMHFMDHGVPKFRSVLHRIALKCKERGEYLVLSRLYQRWCLRHHHPFPEEAYPDICAACVAYGTKAISSQYSPILESQTDETVLAACQLAWSALLQRKWNDTKNLDSVKEYFVKMCKLAGEDNVDTAFYNAMIRICILAGQSSEAERVLRQMQQNKNMTPDLTTFRHFILSAAKVQDWNAVQNMLSLLGSATMMDPSADRTRWFSPVLQEYVLHHGPQEIWSFVSAAVDNHSVVPTHEMSSVVLEYLIGGMRLDLVPPWLDYMQSCGLQTKLNAHAAMRMIRRYYHDTRPHHIVMMNLYRNLKHSTPELCSQDLVLLLRESIGFDVRHRGTGANAPRLMEKARERLNLVNSAEDFAVPEESPSSEDLDSEYPPDPVAAQTADDILLSLSLGQHNDAIALYREAVVASGLPHSSFSLEAAITASLRAQDGGSIEAEELLGSAQDAGFDVSSALMPLMIQRIKQGDKLGESELDELEKTVLRFYQVMNEKNIPVRHHVATTAAHVLIEFGRADKGVSLLRTVYESPWTTSHAGKPFDTPAMTVFMQGYVKMGHQTGIEWTVRTVLEKNLRIDNAFLKVMRRARTHFRVAFRTTGSSQYADLAQVIEELRRVCKERQDEQIEKTTRFGNKLIGCIANVFRKEPPVDISYHELRKADLLWDKWDEPFNPAAKPNNGQADLGTRQPAVFSEHEKVVLYRAFLRRGLQDADGRRLRFRYVDMTPLK